MGNPFDNRILVFLPETAAAMIAARLREIGYITSIACSVPELRQALGSADYSLVVTTRPDIDTVRDIKPLPVINLEIFFHPDMQGASLHRSKQFDATAFLGRVKALTEPRRPRELPCEVTNAVPGRGPNRWFSRLLPTGVWCR